jgi:hypothetical protein
VSVRFALALAALADSLLIQIRCGACYQTDARCT